MNTYVFIVLTLVSATLASSKFEFPIGVNFGVKEITSGYISGNGDFVAVASVQASQAWRDYAARGIDNEVHNRDARPIPGFDARKVGIPELLSIQTATAAKLNREIEILGFTSATFYEHGYGFNVFNVGPLLSPENQPSLAWSYLHSIRMGLQLNDPESLGYPIGTNIDLVNCHLLHFDYQSKSIQVSITSLLKDMTKRQDRFRITDFGGEEQNASAESLEDLTNRTRNFINKKISTPYSLYDDHPPKLSDFRRIIFSGDAPASEFQRIRDSITTMIPQFADRFIEGVEPRWVGALGAARLATLATELKLQPWLWEIPPYTLVDSHTRSHDDL